MKKIQAFISSNFDTLIALIVSIFAAIYGIFGGNEFPLLAGIVTTLGIIAFGLIRDRIERETLKKHIAELGRAVAELSTGKVGSSKFFYLRTDLPELSSRLKKAKNTIDIIGTSLFSLAVTHQGALRDLKSIGVKIRLIVSNPDNLNLQKFLAMRFLEAETADTHIRQVRASLSSLEQILGAISSGGSIEVRLLDDVQSYSYMAIDSKQPYGEIQIEFYLTKTGLDRDPMFLLDPINDVHWFREFQNQFEYLWEHSLDYNSKKGKLKSRQ